MSNKIQLATKSLEKAEEVLKRFNGLSEARERLKAKIEGARFSNAKHKPSAEDLKRFARAQKMFRELNRMHRVIKNKLATMPTTKEGTPEAIRVYDKMIIAIERAEAAYKELDKLLDEARALPGA